MTKETPLVPGGYYHIYNRGNNRENIFREARNYDYFLRLYARHIFPVADTYKSTVSSTTSANGFIHLIMHIFPIKPPAYNVMRLWHGSMAASN